MAELCKAGWVLSTHDRALQVRAQDSGAPITTSTQVAASAASSADEPSGSNAKREREESDPPLVMDAQPPRRVRLPDKMTTHLDILITVAAGLSGVLVGCAVDYYARNDGLVSLIRFKFYLESIRIFNFGLCAVLAYALFSFVYLTPDAGPTADWHGLTRGFVPLIPRPSLKKRSRNTGIMVLTVALVVGAYLGLRFADVMEDAFTMFTLFENAVPFVVYAVSFVLGWRRNSVLGIAGSHPRTKNSRKPDVTNESNMILASGNAGAGELNHGDAAAATDAALTTLLTAPPAPRIRWRGAVPCAWIFALLQAFEVVLILGLSSQGHQTLAIGFPIIIISNIVQSSLILWLSTQHLIDVVQSSVIFPSLFIRKLTWLLWFAAVFLPGWAKALQALFESLDVGLLWCALVVYSIWLDFSIFSFRRLANVILSGKNALRASSVLKKKKG
jgi:hypothetical protein